MTKQQKTYFYVKLFVCLFIGDGKRNNLRFNFAIKSKIDISFGGKAFIIGNKVYNFDNNSDNEIYLYYRTIFIIPKSSG